MKLAVGIGVGLALATSAVTGGWHERRSLVLIAGVGLLIADLFQLFELAVGGQNTLGGDLSTVSLLLGGGIGLTAIGWVEKAA